MSESRDSEIREAFHRQAGYCRALGSPLTADVIEAAAGALDRLSETGRRVFDWPGDPSSAADILPLRIAGGLHALARSGDHAALAAAYRGEGDVAAAVADAIAAEDARLAPWLDSAPQTNEPGRAALVMAGLMVAAACFPMPVELLEIGSSAGLVLNLARYRYDLGGRTAGDPDSPLLLAPEWSGSPPPDAEVAILSARGVDLNPVYLSAPEAAERLLAYVWPDQPGRIARLEAAIGLARAFPPPVVAGDAADWTERQLAAPQAEGVLRVIFHTVVLQYLPEASRSRVIAAIEAAGRRATGERPFGWIAFEFNDARRTMELRLRLWPGGEARHLADCHPHGDRVEWRA